MYCNSQSENENIWRKYSRKSYILHRLLKRTSYIDSAGNCHSPSSYKNCGCVSFYYFFVWMFPAAWTGLCAIFGPLKQSETLHLSPSVGKMHWRFTNSGNGHDLLLHINLMNLDMIKSVRLCYQTDADR